MITQIEHEKNITEQYLQKHAEKQGRHTVEYSEYKKADSKGRLKMLSPKESD